MDYAQRSVSIERLEAPLKTKSVLIACELAFAAAFLAAACSSTSSVLSAPSPAKCTVATTPSSATVGADGGSGRANVTAARECAWTTSSEAAWVVITDGQSGQGDGSISFEVAANPSPVARTASIAVNDQRVALTQDAASCRFTLDHTADTFGSQGGTGSVAVTTASACDWTAMSLVPWISITSGATTVGSGTVTFMVAGSAAETRRGEILIAGHRFTVDQNTVAAPGCTASINPTILMVPARGALASINISTPSGCAWTATSATSWLTPRTDSGVGAGSVQIDVGANAAQTARTGTATIAGQTFTVQQAAADPPLPPPPACTYAISPTNAAAAAGGGAFTATVNTQGGCTWTATSATSWLTLRTDSGVGAGSVQIDVGANAAQTARTGTATIAGHTFTVQQAAAEAPPPPPPPPPPPARTRSRRRTSRQRQPVERSPRR